ncbi:MBL fold metallo-hydrolase [Aureimonas altamirensis]|uniref:MBL fold metallo-hydrolase n=1 Tax=Aureimonas altamirensis TaxID=370622 RepID=UPI003016C2D6
MAKFKSRSALAAFGLVLLGAAFAGSAETGAQTAALATTEFDTDAGRMAVTPVQQMSVVVEAPSGVLYTDPTGGAARYAAHPAPDIILISHEHREHYDADTLDALMGPDTRIVVPPFVMDRLPEPLKARAVSLANGQKAAFGSIEVEAIASHGLGGQAMLWHPPGRGNGYVVTLDGRRLYVAGSTEAVPEMLALKDIYLAFLPLYPPYALSPESAAQAVAAFEPDYAYIYQYDSRRSRDGFVRLAGDGRSRTVVVAPEIGC